MPFFNKKHIVFSGLLLGLGLLLWLASSWTYTVAIRDLAGIGRERVALYAGSLQAALSRYAYLPYILANNPHVRGLLAGYTPADGVNYFLEDLNREAGSEALYVMNVKGDTLAANNWRDRQTYVGENYRFRPYFLDAKAGRRGWYFGIGATTGKPGYFMSCPVYQEEEFLGAVIVKVDLAPLQKTWNQGGETVLVSDSNGVFFLASRDDWRYRTLRPLAAGQIEKILAAKQYGKQDLQLLPLQQVEVLGDGQQIIRYQDRRYLMLSQNLPERGWQIHHLQSLVPAEESRRDLLQIGGVTLLLFLACALYLRERQQKKRSRLKAQQAETLQRMNTRLQAEIEERSKTEQVLRNTQDELIQAGKLAALGHMAAGIVHELNQPIAAIRTHAASCRLLISRRHPEQAAETLQAISRITEHMASITSQLKSFAHKSPQHKEAVVLQDSVRDVLAMTEPLLAKRKIELQTDIPAQRIEVMAERGRIRQVLVNLVSNAIDAMKDSSPRRLTLTIVPLADEVEISISDTGPGIRAEDLEEIFTPFYTTKQVGEGMGLGLSISYRIVTDLGGSIKGFNLPQQGACFQVKLPTLRRIPGDE